MNLVRNVHGFGATIAYLIVVISQYKFWFPFSTTLATIVSIVYTPIELLCSLLIDFSELFNRVKKLFRG